MKLALGLDSRDVPAAKYADPKEELDRLYGKESIHELVYGACDILHGMGAAAILVGGATGAFDNFPSWAMSTAGMTTVLVTSLIKDIAHQKIAMLKIKQEELKRAANPQLYIENAIKDKQTSIPELEESVAEAKKLVDHNRMMNEKDGRPIIIAYSDRYNWACGDLDNQKKEAALWQKAYDLAKQKGKIKELSQLICNCETYKRIDELVDKTDFQLQERCLGAFGMSAGLSFITGINLFTGIHNNPERNRGLAGVFAAELGAYIAKNVVRYVKSKKIEKEEEKAYDAIEDFVNKGGKER